jgi:nitrate/nitrite transporter NarK
LLWQLLTVWFGVSCVNKGLDSWMPIYLLQQRGLDLKAVGILTPIPFLLATIATAIGGWVMTRFFRERERFLLIVSAALTGIFLFAMYESKTIGALIFSSRWSISSNRAGDRRGAAEQDRSRDQIGTGLGMINFGGQCAGFVAPTVMGFLVTGTGSFDAAFDFLLAMTILAVVVATMIRNREVLVESLA